MAERISISPFGRLTGYYASEVAEGEVTMELPVDERLFNTADIVHGGALNTLADAAAGAAVMTILGDDRFPVTMDFHMSFLRPVKYGVLRAHAVVIHSTAKTARVEVTLRESGREVARAFASFMIVTRARLGA